MTDRYSVIGNPVSHSLSPRIHAMFARATAQRISYGKLQAPADGFAAAAERFFAEGGKGLNVTVPFKVDAWRWSGRHDPAAQASGAVNTIVLEEHGTLGCNTDGAGLVNDLRRLGWPLDGARLLILGAGGAVRGVLKPLQDAGAAPTIANRTRSKAERLAAQFRVASCGLDEVAEGWDLIVNATSAGLADEGALVAPRTVAATHCYDLFYSIDRQTPFCRWAAQNGAGAVSDGLGMLVEQAALAFHRWRGVRPPVAGVAEALRAGGGEV